MKSHPPLPAVVLGTLIAALAAGCATEDANAPAGAAPRASRGDTITGSHIPSKNALPPQSDAEREKTVERMKELQKSSQPPQKLPS